MTIHSNQVSTLESLYTGAKDVSRILVQEVVSDEDVPTQKGVSNPSSTEYAREVFTEESVEGLLAVDEYERMKEFCEKCHVTNTQALLAAFHVFLVRHIDEDGKKTYTVCEYPHATFGEDFTLEIKNDISGCFDDLLRHINSLSHLRVGSKTSPRHCELRLAYDQELISYDLWNVIITDNIALETIGNSNIGLKLRLIYQPAIYTSKEMECSLDNFLRFWSSILASSHVSLLALPLCGDKELSRQRQFYWAQNISINAWDNMTIIEKFLEAADKHPQNTAVLTSDGEALTYGGLIHRSCEIAFCVQEAGASPGDSIGLLCHPGLDEIAGMIGILMSRCGYVAMDPSFAIERLSFMMEDSKAPMILVAPDLTTLGTEIADKSQSSPQIMQFPGHHQAYSPLSILKSSPQDPFYTNYTSGSTGLPKGVVLTQSNTHQMLSTLHHTFKTSKFDRFLHHSSISFDVSVMEIFAALTCGAAVCVASAQIKTDPEPLSHFMKQASITFTAFAPTKFALLLDSCQDNLQQCQEYRIAMFGGEPLPVRVKERFYNLQLRAKVYNAWGPSEVTVSTTFHEVSRDISASMTNTPIGFPTPNCAHYIVDSNLNPVPIGVVGEICVGGTQVGRGYNNKLDGTCKAFIQNPFASEEYIRNGWTRLFRTGDRGRFLANGELEFHGRIAGDKQIKLRGLRMNLGEIEHRIFEASKISGSVKLIDVAVVARSVQDLNSREESMTDNRQLIAFLVLGITESKSERQSFVSEIHQHLEKYLSAYMLPNGYEILAVLPTTAGGKSDTRNLQHRDLNLLFASKKPLPGVDKVTSNVFDEVADPTLSNVISIFRTVLAFGEDFQVSPDDNLFDLGGQSMILLRLQSKIKTTFGVKLPLPILFQHPTPAAIAQLVRDQHSNVTSRVKNIRNSQIDWQAETRLPDQNEFLAPQSFRRLSPTEISTILVTGAESFVGVQTIATILTTAPSMRVFFVGSAQAITLADMKTNLARYQLLNDNWSDLSQRLIPIRGTLAQPLLGLHQEEFVDLGKALHAIYHIGSQVSLLKSYYDLKSFNVSPILTLISLAHHGSCLVEIHYLSTWSVPHLQTWRDTKRREGVISASEELIDHITPSTSPTQGGYFKARWASEILLARAAQRGFRVSIYRSSAVTASSTTKVPEPMYDLYRYFIMRMIQVRCVPEMPAVATTLPFAIDFVPVDYLASTVFRLSLSPAAALPAEMHGVNTPMIYHIGNPAPLLLRNLPSVIPQVLRHEGTEPDVRVLPLEEWLLIIGSKLAAGEELRMAAIREMFAGGHCSFALDRTNTAAALALMEEQSERNEIKKEIKERGWVSCPPVDAEYLRGMLESSG